MSTVPRTYIHVRTSTLALGTHTSTVPVLYEYAQESRKQGIRGERGG